MISEIIYISIPIIFTIYSINIISFNNAKYFKEFLKIINTHEIQIENILNND